MHLSLTEKLVENRIIFICGEINTQSAMDTIVQMLYLESVDPNADINLYINSPGGSVSDGLAVIDVMRRLKCDVSTIAVGMAASMGSMILACGTPGKRYALEHAEIMIHAPSTKFGGSYHEIENGFRHISRIKECSVDLYEKATGRTVAEIEAALQKDNYMTAGEAKSFGLIDEVI